MKNYKQLRDKARNLRKSGNSLPFISDKLNLNSSTVFYWIRDLPKPKFQCDWKLRTKNARKSNIAKYTGYRDLLYQYGLDEYPILILKDTFLDFITIYACEGTRRGRNYIAVTNINPALLKLAFYWFTYFKRPTKKVEVVIRLYSDQWGRRDKFITYWLTQFNVVKNDIKLRVELKTGAKGLIGRTEANCNGLVELRLSDTYLKSRIDAWLTLLNKRWDVIS